jgi:hypothetical protein
LGPVENVAPVPVPSVFPGDPLPARVETVILGDPGMVTALVEL